MVDFFFFSPDFLMTLFKKKKTAKVGEGKIDPAKSRARLIILIYNGKPDKKKKWRQHQKKVGFCGKFDCIIRFKCMH